jgi:hypothetical protein
MRVLKALLVTIIPIVATVVGIVQAVDGGSFWQVIVDTLGAAITTGLQIAFWTTLGFAAIERFPAMRVKTAMLWTPVELPEPPSRRARFWELVTLTVLTVLFTTLMLLSRVFSTEQDGDGNPIGLFSPWLWDTGVIYVFIALVIASLAYAFVKYYVRWSFPLAVVGALVDLAPALLLVWLSTENRLLNPAFIEAAGWSANVERWIEIGIIIAAVTTLVHTISEEVSRARGR